MNECDTCAHNRGSHCGAEACDGGSGYEDNRVRICRRCGGKLSTLRIQNGRRLRHCFSCHFDFEEDDEP